MRLQWLGGPWDGTYEVTTPGMPTHAVPYDTHGIRAEMDAAVEVRLYSIVSIGEHQRILWREIPTSDQRVS